MTGNNNKNNKNNNNNKVTHAAFGVSIIFYVLVQRNGALSV